MFSCNEIELNNQLKTNGYVVFDIDKSRVGLSTIASIFGTVIHGDHGDIIQTLRAQEKGNGSYGSFTYKVGYDCFPWHTDTAYWSVPARYLLLTSDMPSPCATTVRSFASIATSIEEFDYLVRRAVYLLDIPGKRRYLSPIIQEGGKIGYRLDLHIYRPMNHEAKQLSYLVQEQLLKEYYRVVWTGSNVAVIDNWQMIHSREAAYNDKNRVLKRIYINELV